MSNKEVYLGDNVCAEMKNGALRLATKDGDNVLWIGSSAYEALVRYVEQTKRDPTA